MAERIKPTRSGLFAIELLIAVGLIRSAITSERTKSADLTRAVSEARSVAECFKAAGGDLEKTAELTGGQIVEDTVFVAFDENWEKLGPGAQGTYEAVLACSPESGYTGASLSVQRYERSGGDQSDAHYISRNAGI